MIADDMRLQKDHMLAKHKRTYEDLNKGDFVRLLIKNRVKETFTKFYTANWSKELFQINQINNSYSRFEQPTYIIKDPIVTHPNQRRNELQRVDVIG